MIGHNYVWISGNVGGKLITSQTRDNTPACSFSVASEDPQKGTTWVRVNAYGSVALTCQKNASKGRYVSIVGELMNRDGKCGELTEVRAKDVIFYPNLMPAGLKDDASDPDFGWEEESK